MNSELINKYGITHTGLLDSDLNEEQLLAAGLINKTGLFDGTAKDNKAKDDSKTGGEHTETTDGHTGKPETHTETIGNTETHTETPDPKVNTGSEVVTNTETTGNTETHTETPDPKVNTGSETHTELNANPEAGVIPTPTVPNSDGLVSTETYSGAEESDPKPNGKPTKPKRGGDAVANAETDIETSTDAETADVAAESEDLRTSGRSRGLRANTNPKRPKIADEPEDHVELDAAKPSGEDIPMDHL